MKTSLHFIGICAAWLASVIIATAQVPQMISYQGRAKTTAGVPFTGMGHFQFALVDNGAANTYWSNDGTEGAGLFPELVVHLPVNNGVYSVHLGNTGIEGMTARIPPSVFANDEVYFRVWFSDGSVPPALTTPDTRIVSVGYAMIAATVVDGNITEGKLADGGVTTVKLADHAVTSDKLASGSVTGSELADEISLGSVGLGVLSGVAGKLSLYSGGSLLSGLGLGISLQLDGSSGVIKASEAFQVGSDDDIAAWLGATESSGGELKLYQADGVTRGVTLLGDSSDGTGGGLINVLNPDGEKAVTIDGNAANDAGGILIYQSDGSTAGINFKGDAEDGGGLIVVRQNDDDVGVYIDGNDENGAGFVSIRNTEGHVGIQLFGAESATDNGGQVLLYNSNQKRTVQIDGNATDSEGWLGLYRPGKTEAVIQLDAYDADGKGRITTEVLEITGGSDLSESFEITTGDDLDIPKPGLIVCIDPDSPGHLMVSSKAYDRTVAGVVSGAGGVKPGMLMGQHGTAASGKHPVALTGRVYCQSDASNGGIQPGDLLTSSALPGHAMKVTDHTRAQGAIIGKAMTPLASGTGLVLVLVSLQ